MNAKGFSEREEEGGREGGEGRGEDSERGEGERGEEEEEAVGPGRVFSVLYVIFSVNKKGE